MDKVAGFLEIWQTDDTHKIIIGNSALNPDHDRSVHIELSNRDARYLANLLIEFATYAEGEAAATLPKRWPYRRLNGVRGLSTQLPKTTCNQIIGNATGAEL